MTRKRGFFDSKKARIGLLIVSTLLSVIGAMVLVEGQNLTSVGYQEKENAIMAKTGELAPFEVDKSQPFDLIFGNVIFVYRSADLVEGIDLNRAIEVEGVSYPIQIEFADTKLLVSAEIKNANNVTIAKIVDNQWAISPDPLLVRDRNYNAYAFEVIDSDLVPVLQVIMVGNNRILIGFIAYGESQRVLVTEEAGIITNPSEETINAFKDSTLFLYPSSNHLGEMRNTDYLSDSPLLEANRKITEGNILQVIGVILTGAFGIGSIIEAYKLLKTETKPEIVLPKERKRKTRKAKQKKRKYKAK